MMAIMKKIVTIALIWTVIISLRIVFMVLRAVQRVNLIRHNMRPK